MAISKTSKLRRQQQTSGGHGTLFKSPNRKRYKKKMQERVFHRDLTGRYRGLHERLKELRARAEAEENEVGDQDMEDESEGEDDDDAELGYQDDIAEGHYGEAPEPEPIPDTQPPHRPPTPEHGKIKRRILPNTADFSEYRHWQTNIEEMVDAYLSYTTRTLGKPVKHEDAIGREHCACTELKESSLTLLYFDRASLIIPAFNSPTHSTT